MRCEDVRSGKCEEWSVRSEGVRDGEFGGWSVTRVV